MEKNKKTIAIIIAIIVAIICTIIFLNSKHKQETYFSKVKFNDNNYVVNHTNMKFADTIVLAGLHALNIKNVDVLILPMDISRTNDVHFEAYIIHLKRDPSLNIDPSKENKYLIRIKNFSRMQSIEILSHELIHLKQMNTLKLGDNGKFIIWNNKVYENIPDYFDRPWEIEAFNQQDDLKNKIKNHLYR